MAATFGWLGQRPSQPANFGSQILLAGPEAQPAKWLGLSHMAAIQPNVCNSAKWLVISQMATTQPNGYSSAIWMGLSQVAGTQFNGCDSAKKLGIGKKIQLNRGKHNMAIYLFIERQRTLLYYGLFLFKKIIYSKMSRKNLPKNSRTLAATLDKKIVFPATFFILQPCE